MNDQFPSLRDILATVLVPLGPCDEWTDEEADRYIREVDEAWRRARTVTTVQQLASLPRGTVVESAKGTIGAHCGDQRGVVFGDERPFGWQTLALPAVVLWHPDWTNQ